MAHIKVENRRFTVEFQELDADGKSAPFTSVYTLGGKPVAIRQPDKRSDPERYGWLVADRPRSTVRQAIYQARPLGGYLVVVDKLQRERQVFIHWRTGSARTYRRVALGSPAFHHFGPEPYPNISRLIFVGGRFFIAWITDDRPEGELILSSIDPKRAARSDTVVASKMGLVTVVSLAHIGTHGLIVCARAMIGGKDATIDVFPVRLGTTA